MPLCAPRFHHRMCLLPLLRAGLRAEDPGLPKEEDLAGMSIAQLKAHLNKYSISSRDCVERRCD